MAAADYLIVPSRCVCVFYVCVFCVCVCARVTYVCVCVYACVSVYVCVLLCMHGCVLGCMCMFESVCSHVNVVSCDCQ